MNYPAKLVRTLSRRGFVRNSLGVGLGLAVTTTSVSTVLATGVHSKLFATGAEINVWTGWTEEALARMDAALAESSTRGSMAIDQSLIPDSTMRKQLLSVAGHVDHGSQYFVCMSRSSTPPVNELEAQQQMHELGVWRLSVSTDKAGIRHVDARKLRSSVVQNAGSLRRAIRVGSDYLCSQQNDLYFYRLLV